MSNILDYILWRGDLSMEASPFNDIDALILCQISYLDFDGLLPDCDFSRSITLAELADLFKNSPDFETRSDTGMLINKLTVQLLFDVGASVRFGKMRITGYASIIDLNKEEQFSAMSYFTDDKTAFIAYRGTDDTIVGWKEDFNLAIMDTVPAQLDAVKYLEKASKFLHGNLRIGGHSKGGNLSIYAASKMPANVKKRIECIYNNDGPGFADKIIQSEEFEDIVPKIHSFYPYFSIVGMLFSHAGKFSVIESDESGIMQHDPFSWHLKGINFVILDGFDPAGKFFHDTLNTWLSGLNKDQLELFIETLFGVLQATEARTNSELEENLLRNSARIIAALRKLDPETRNAVAKIINLLFKIARRKLPDISALAEMGKVHVAKVSGKKRPSVSGKTAVTAKRRN